MLTPSKGKTTVTGTLQRVLGQAPHNLKVAIFSIDDLYLPHAGLKALERTHPHNRLLHGRGQPGTHDVALGKSCLDALREARPVQLPVFDKSQRGGEGDRSERTILAEPPIDVVLFEGWCIGFASIGEQAIKERYTAAASSAPARERRPYFLDHPVENLVEIDERLRQFEEQWYPYLDAFIQMRPVDASRDPARGLENVFAWRLQAEHAMKAQNGGKGMTDEQVHAFVERYMPGYEIWGDQVTQPQRPWHGKGLRIDIDPKRDIVGAAQF